MHEQYLHAAFDLSPATGANQPAFAYNTVFAHTTLLENSHYLIQLNQINFVLFALPVNDSFIVKKNFKVQKRFARITVATSHKQTQKTTKRQH